MALFCVDIFLITIINLPAARVKQIPQIYRYKRADLYLEMILFFAFLSNTLQLIEMHFESMEGMKNMIIVFQLTKKICYKN